ncbi:MAG: hypothetical protein FWE03_04925 [Firmicutes bacterium]|nr:hypothetical protein [Bacillota bacterium]
MNKENIMDKAPESIDEGQKENMSLWDIANMEAGTDIDEISATEDIRYKNYGDYTMISSDDEVSDTSKS